MRSYIALIEELLDGSTPKEKHDYLESLINENARAKGRLDFATRQFQIIYDNPETDPYTRGYVGSILKTLSTPL